MNHPTGSEPLVRLADGTVKQVSPLTGTVVWTIPGRAHRPLALPSSDPVAVDPATVDRLCAFCPGRRRETPPERARLVADPHGGPPMILREVPADELDRTTALLRRIPNLFEILSVDYWRTNHGFTPPPPVVARAERYLAGPDGREHVLAVLHRRALAAGVTPQDWDALTPDEQLRGAVDLFAGSHDVVVPRRHLVEGAKYDDELAGSGTMTPDEHHDYTTFTIDTLRDLYASQPHARYVAVFQNWLRPAGASFDHLHKQLVAIDEHGPQIDRELARLRVEPDVFTTAVLDHAAAHRLVVAQNDHAIAVAGVGHRYPALEVYSTSPRQLPWEHTAAEVRAVSDLLHGLHAATGVRVPSNEEWHHRPPDATEAMPWRIVLKWRVSTLAGFEGGTKINVNTIDPAGLRDRVVGALHDLRRRGTIAGMLLGDECSHRLGVLRYDEPPA